MLVIKYGILASSITSGSMLPCQTCLDTAQPLPTRTCIPPYVNVPEPRLRQTRTFIAHTSSLVTTVPFSISSCGGVLSWCSLSSTA